MRVKLPLLLLLLTLTGALALVACGSSSQSDTQAEAEAQAASQAAAVAGYVLPDDAENHLGEEVTVRGKMVDYQYRTAREGKPTLLLFEMRDVFLPGRNVSHTKKYDSFSVLIWREDKKNFPSNFTTLYTDKVLCATGTVELFFDAPVIIAKDESQIQLNC